MYKKYYKNTIDFFLTIMALLLLSPLLAIVYLLIKIKLGSPVIFKQTRPGKDEKLFTMYKFRTMTDERDGQGELLPDELRLTKFGQFLRATSIDELPELINILKGEMSIVGPRPLLVDYLPLYNNEQKRRHEVRPGLSGWAQVNGRNAISWEKKFAYDIYYVDNLSFLLDFKIIFLTIKKIFIREGISSDTSVTMERFRGSKVDV